MSSGRAGLYLEGKVRDDVPVTTLLGDSALPTPAPVFMPVGLVAAKNANDTNKQHVYVFDRAKTFGGSPIITQRLLNPVGELSNVPSVDPPPSNVITSIVVTSGSGTFTLRAEQQERMYYIQRSNGVFRARLTYYFNGTCNVANSKMNMQIELDPEDISPPGWGNDVSTAISPDATLNISVDNASFAGNADGGTIGGYLRAANPTMLFWANIFCGTTDPYVYRLTFDIPLAPKIRPIE